MPHADWSSYEQAEVEKAFAGVQEIPEEFRTPENYRLEEVGGEIYPIPLKLYGVDLGKEGWTDDYWLKDNGALVSESAEVDGEVELGPQAIVEKLARLIGDTSVGEKTRIGTGAFVFNAHIGRLTTISSGAKVEQSSVGNKNDIGTYASIFAAELGVGVKVGDSAKVRGKVGPGSSIGKNSVVERSTLAAAVTIGEETYVADSDVGFHVGIGNGVFVSSAVVEKFASIESGANIPGNQDSKVILKEFARILQDARLEAGREIQAREIVVPYGKKKTVIAGDKEPKH